MEVFMPVRLRNIEDAVSRFSADDRGNVAIILALAAIPVLGATGAAVDYSRALQGRGSLQRVADSAALAAAKMSNATPAQRRKLATTMVENQLSTIPNLAMGPLVTVSEPSAGRVKVEVDAAIATSVIKLLGYDQIGIGTTAVAVSPSEAEVALALDTTGSMKDDMGTLRDTATKFVQTLYQAAPKDALRVSVVPYVAAVNPGRSVLLDSGSVDVSGSSSTNANNMRGRYIGAANVGNCNNTRSPP